MERPFPRHEPANDVGISFEPRLDDQTLIQLGVAIRDTLAPRGLDRFRRDQREDGGVSYVHRNSTEKPWWEEIIYRASADEVRFIWGPGTDPDPALDILQHVGAEVTRRVATAQLRSYRAERIYSFPSTGNAYERIARAIFADGPIAAFYQLMRRSVPDFRVGDNDSHLIFHLSRTRTGILRIRGRTSRWEIIDDHFDDDPLTLVVGVQDDLPPATAEAFPQCLVELVRVVQRIDGEHVRPTIGAALQAVTTDANGEN
jgi:hypothetical protein